MFKIVNGKLIIDGEEIDEADVKAYFKAQGIKTKPAPLEAEK